MDENFTLTANNTALLIGIGIECLLGVSAFIGNSFFIVCLWRLAIIGKNLRLLLSNLSIASIVAAVYYFGNSMYILYFATWTDNIGQLKATSIIACRLQEVPKVIAQQVIA